MNWTEGKITQCAIDGLFETHKTSLTLPLFIEVPVREVNGHAYVC